MPQLKSKYCISARLDFETGMYRLYNHDWPAGDRLRRGDTKTNWPFVGEWTTYDNEDAAKVAAQVLQRYLDKHEPRK